MKNRLPAASFALGFGKFLFQYKPMIRRVFIFKATFCGRINTPVRILLLSVILAMSGEISQTVAQDTEDSSSDSASELAASRYEAAGSSYGGPHRVPITRPGDIDDNTEAMSWTENVPLTPNEDVGSMVAATPNPENTARVLGPYQTIVERNVFDLQSAPVANLQSAATAVPKQDLVLTGLADLGATRCALFMVTEPGKAPTYFTLHEGEQNEWLEIHSIDVGNGTVKALLKQPLMRIRQTGTEVILSVQINGAQR